MKARFRAPWLALLALAVVLGGVLWLGSATGTLSAQPAAAEPTASRDPYPGLASGDPYLIADIAERVTPAVVYIEVEWPQVETPRRPRLADPFFDRFFFGWPFDPFPPGGQARRSRGSGFIIDNDGHILTNQHVVGNPGEGQTVTVKISAKGFEGEVPAEVIGADYRLDLAILKIEKPKELDRLPVIPLGNSDESRPGEWVIAIGNPYGEELEHTVTVGVLSAKGRRIELYDRENGQLKTYTNLMQTDAAINPGNSGGPLLNLKGEAIGINTAINASAQGIGFAIPINTALEVKDELITEGRVVRTDEEAGAFLGVRVQNVTEELASALGLEEASGAVVVGVERNSAAEQAGLRIWDVILQVGDEVIEDSSGLVETIAGYKPGDQALLLIARGGNRIAVPVTFGARM